MVLIKIFKILGSQAWIAPITPVKGSTEVSVLCNTPNTLILDRHETLIESVVDYDVEVLSRK